MAGNRKKASKSDEAYYARAKNSKIAEVNREKKLLRAQKEQPNNKQIEKALGSIVYRRNTPKTHVWHKSMITTARLFKEFTGRFNKNYFNNDPKISEPACHERNTQMIEDYRKWFSKKPVDKRSMFSIGVRAYNA